MNIGYKPPITNTLYGLACLTSVIGGGLTRSHSFDVTYRNKPFLARYGEDSVVAVGAPGRRVDEKEDVLVDNLLRNRLGKHDVEKCGLEDGCRRIERQTSKLALDQGWDLCHHSPEHLVSSGALPAGDEVEHVDALGCLPALDTCGTRKLNLKDGEEGSAGHLVLDAHEPGVEVDVGEQGRNPNKRRVLHGKQRRNSFKEEEWVYLTSPMLHFI
jgi:hypothetical protein